MGAKRPVVAAVALAGALIILSGCGSSNYGSTFDAVVPSTWTKVSETGQISSSCTNGANCGDVERTYQMNAPVQQASADLERRLESHSCTATKDGNGISSDCTTGVHLAVSFSTTTASITLTKRAGS